MQILNITKKPETKYFGYTDSKGLFEENLIKMPKDWVWRNKEVLYTFNSQGYRAPEWKDVDWNNSVLMFGCSYVYGVGINREEACPAILSDLLNIPVINLGCPGSSPLFQWVNSTILKSEYKIRPKAVIYYWPYTQRLAELQMNRDTINHPSQVIKGAFNERWAESKEHRVEFLRYLILNTNAIWDCPVLHYHMDLPVCKLIDELKYMKHSDIKTYIDPARDYPRKYPWHAGPKTNVYWAEIMFKDLTKLLYI